MPESTTQKRPSMLTGTLPTTQTPPQISIRLLLFKVLSSQLLTKKMVCQLTITTEDLLNKDLCKSIMIIDRIPTLAFLTMLQFPTLRDSHLTGDQTELQSLQRISNLNCGPMETELDQRSKTSSGIWDISQRIQLNSTSGLDTQTSTPRTREMVSQVLSTDSTLRNLLDIDTITTVSNFD